MGKKVDVITEETKRLCRSIVAWRKGRRALLAGLARENGERKTAVSLLRAELAGDRREMARQTKANRVAFLAGLRGAIAAQQREWQADRAGGRLAWLNRAAPATQPATGEMAPPAHRLPAAPRKSMKKNRYR